MATLQDLTLSVITRLSQVPGIATQTYAEGRIKDMIQRGFNTIFDDLWWAEFTHWRSDALNGTTGEVTTDLSAITNPLTRWTDIRGVWVDDEQSQLATLPSTLNPYTLSGTRPRFVSPSGSTTTVFKVWPTTATGNIRLQYRSLPAAFTDTTEIPIDNDVLLFFACWEYMEDDATNPGATERFQTLFENRLQQLKRNQNNQPIALDNRIKRTVTDWYEA